MVHPAKRYFLWVGPPKHVGQNTVRTWHKGVPHPALMHEGGTGLGAGRIIGAFFQQFETLPQPLPELREGGYIVLLSGIQGGRNRGRRTEGHRTDPGERVPSSICSVRPEGRAGGDGFFQEGEESGRV